MNILAFIVTTIILHVLSVSAGVDKLIPDWILNKVDGPDKVSENVELIFT
jgi:hypothetical protein